MSSGTQSSGGKNMARISPNNHDTARIEAARLALDLGSAALDVASLVAEWAEELPYASIVLKTLKAINNKIEEVHTNKEELVVLQQRCAYVTACLFVRYKRISSDVDFMPLEEFLRDAEKLVERCGSQGRFERALKARRNKDDIKELHGRLDQLITITSLALASTTQGTVEEVEELLNGAEEKHGEITRKLSAAPPEGASTQLALVPSGTPRRMAWHVDRPRVLTEAVDWLCVENKPQLVGLVGHSGSGKTTAAADIIRDTKVREFFSDGIAWLPIDAGAKDRLPTLMRRLVDMHFIVGRIGGRPTNKKDFDAYVKEHIRFGHGGKGLRFLLVADNVWEQEVLSILQRTGMWILVATRDEKLVTDAGGQSVRVDRLSDRDAESLLRGAAELPEGARLSDPAMEAIGLCNHVAMDLAFVGRWSMVRGREDHNAWSEVVLRIRSELEKVTDEDLIDGDYSPVKRREAILRAGFDCLTLAVEDERIQHLYLSLAVMPDGHEFTVRDAAVLLFDHEPSFEDLSVTRSLLSTLERWTILVSVNYGKYYMHDAHRTFARGKLSDRRDILQDAVARWTKSISSLDVVRYMDPYVLKRLWLAVEHVSGQGWDSARSYGEAVVNLNNSDPLCRQTVEAVGHYQMAQGDWSGASKTWVRLLELEQRDLGYNHPNVLNILATLRNCAERLGRADDVDHWRQMERATLSLIDTRGKMDAARGKSDAAAGLRSIAVAMAQLSPKDPVGVKTLLRNALKIQETKLGSDDLQVAITSYQLGVFLLEEGCYEEAEVMARRALCIRETMLETSDVKIGHAQHLLGACLSRGGKDGAKEYLERALRILEAGLGADDVEVAYTLYELGMVMSQTTRIHNAKELLRDVLEMHAPNIGHTDQERLRQLYRLIEMLREPDRAQTVKEIWECSIPDPTSSFSLLCNPTLKHHIVPTRNSRKQELDILLRRALGILETKLSTGDSVPMTYTLSQLGEHPTQRNFYGCRMDEAEAYLWRALAILETKLEKNDLTVAYTLHQISVTIDSTRRQEEAEGMLRRALKIEEASLGDDDIQVAKTLVQLAVSIHETGCRQEEAETALRRALAITQANLGEEDLEAAYVLRQLAFCMREECQQKEVEASLRLALAIEKARLGEDDLRVAYTLHDLGVFIGTTGRWHEAKSLLRCALEIEERKFGRNHVLVQSTLFHLATCISQSERVHELDSSLSRPLDITETVQDSNSDFLGLEANVRAAYILDHVHCGCLEAPFGKTTIEKVLRRAIDIDVANLRVDRLEVGYKLHKLGACIGNTPNCWGATRQEEAIVLLRRALTIYETTDTERNISLHVAYALHDLGVCTRKTGRLDEAESLLRRALGMKHDILGEHHASVCRTLHQLVLNLRDMRRNEEAEELSRQALAIEEAKFGKNGVEVTLRLHSISVYFLHKLDVRDEAEVLLRRTLAMEEEVLGKGNVQSGYTLYHLSASIVETPRRDEAAVLLKRALEIFEAQTKEKVKHGSDHFSVPYERSRLEASAGGTWSPFRREIHETQRELAWACSEVHNS